MLRAAGVSRLFGLPGGGSVSDIIAAAERAELPFSLAQTETGSAFMAAAQAEITGRPGAIVATLGPGACSAMNGTAHAYLDRVPLIVITDCEGGARPEGLHQAFAQTQMFAPVTRFSKRLRAGETLPALTELPLGPIHLEVASDFTSCQMDAINVGQALPPAGDFAAIPKSTRPLFLIGLGARSERIAGTVRRLCETAGIPALVTYKAKGVIPDDHPWFGGVFTHGALEKEILEQAGLFIGIGLDPVELLPRPWRYQQPVVSITSWPMQQTQIPFQSELVGDIEATLQQLHLSSDWNPSEVCRLAGAQREKMRIPDSSGSLLPHRVVELTAEVYRGARATVDAGAHMFPVMSLWPALEPNGVLISNGLATMGFALPAAIGAALLDKTKPVIAFTGDGGLLICLGELRTAARERVPVRVIVFDDNVLNLIRIKQIQRDYPTESTFNGNVNWAAVGDGFGIAAMEVQTEQELRTALRDTRGHNGPVLIAAKINGDTYPATMRALRG
jgi:acetolactate synthase-1/2/3 large subunit